MDRINKDANGTAIFKNYRLDTSLKINYKKMHFTRPTYPHSEVDVMVIKQKTKKTKPYKKIRDSLLNSLKKLDSASNFAATKVPIICPCTFYKNERSVEKAMYMYIEFSRFFKYSCFALLSKSFQWKE